MLQHGVEVRSARFLTHGIIAGCGLCSYHVQAYAGASLLQYMARNPDVGVNLHYDDLYTATVADTQAKAEDRLAADMADLEQVVIEELKASIAEHKAVVVASDYCLQRSLTRRLPAQVVAQGLVSRMNR